MSDDEQVGMVADEEELFGTTQPLAPLSPLGPLEASDGPRQSDHLDDAQHEEGLDDGKKKEKEQAKKVRKPRVALNEERLLGKNGIRKLPELFKGVRFKGKGYEKEDLDLLLREMEHWAHIMIPKQRFEDVIDKLELLGRKKMVKLHAQDIQRGAAVADTDDNEIMATLETDGDGLNEMEKISHIPPTTSAHRTDYGPFDEVGEMLNESFGEIGTECSGEMLAE